MALPPEEEEVNLEELLRTGEFGHGAAAMVQEPPAAAIAAQTPALPPAAAPLAPPVLPEAGGQPAPKRRAGEIGQAAGPVAVAEAPAVAPAALFANVAALGNRPQTRGFALAAPLALSAEAMLGPLFAENSRLRLALQSYEGRLNSLAAQENELNTALQTALAQRREAPNVRIAELQTEVTRLQAVQATLRAEIATLQGRIASGEERVLAAVTAQLEPAGNELALLLGQMRVAQQPAAARYRGGLIDAPTLVRTVFATALGTAAPAAYAAFLLLGLAPNEYTGDGAPPALSQGDLRTMVENMVYRQTRIATAVVQQARGDWAAAQQNLAATLQMLRALPAPAAGDPLAATTRSATQQTTEDLAAVTRAITTLDATLLAAGNANIQVEYQTTYGERAAPFLYYAAYEAQQPQNVKTTADQPDLAPNTSMYYFMDRLQQNRYPLSPANLTNVFLTYVGSVVARSLWVPVAQFVAYGSVPAPGAPQVAQAPTPAQLQQLYAAVSRGRAPPAAITLDYLYDAFVSEFVYTPFYYGNVYNQLHSLGAPGAIEGTPLGHLCVALTAPAAGVDRLLIFPPSFDAGVCAGTDSNWRLMARLAALPQPPWTLVPVIPPDTLRGVTPVALAPQ